MLEFFLLQLQFNTGKLYLSSIVITDTQPYASNISLKVDQFLYCINDSLELEYSIDVSMYEQTPQCG